MSITLKIKITVGRNVTVQLLTFPFRVGEILGSISARSSAILTKKFRCLPQSFQENKGAGLKLGHGHIFPHILGMIIH